ncbi:MAG: metallophosphoesterase [Vicinamibacterales bacterium]
MLFGALGDIHGAFAAARNIMERHPEVPFWLCVGDVADAEGRYEPLPAPLHWIKGNNEDFDTIAAGAFPENLHHIPNGQLIELEGLRIAGLGGTFAPTMYDVPAEDLPPGRTPRLGRSARAPAAAASSESSSSAAAARGGGAPRALRAPAAAASRESSSGAAAARGGGAPRALRNDDKRRHFVREEVEACKAMTQVDIFLSHEAPRPFRVHRGIDAGKTPINEILSAMKPRLHLFGHHHTFAEARPSGIRSVCLDLVSASYLLIDATTLEYERVTTADTGVR